MSIRTFITGISCLLFSFGSLANAATDTTTLAPTIPIVDLQDFYRSETKQKFIDDIVKALNEVGFFALVNTDVDIDVIDKSYESCREYFGDTMEHKLTICKPELNGQRGYVGNEIAQGNTVKDLKEFVHIGRERNYWPEWMDFQTPMENLLKTMDVYSEILQRAFALGIGEDEDFFIEMTRNGDCLLRASHYPAPSQEGQMWCAPHTDIDFFTILPFSTEEGLQLFHNGEWIDVRVPANAFIINGGDKMQNLTNGYYKSCFHRVVSKSNAERFSVVYFIHPRLEDSNSPREKSIALTGGVKRYPDATSFEILTRRLVEIGLASPELIKIDQESDYIYRVRDLVESGVASEPVKLTYSIWLRDQDKAEK